jgi:hypothetical protein
MSCAVKLSEMPAARRQRSPAAQGRRAVWEETPNAGTGRRGGPPLHLHGRWSTVARRRISKLQTPNLSRMAAQRQRQTSSGESIERIDEGSCHGIFGGCRQPYATRISVAAWVRTRLETRLGPPFPVLIVRKIFLARSSRCKPTPSQKFPGGTARRKPGWKRAVALSPFDLRPDITASRYRRWCVSWPDPSR